MAARRTVGLIVDRLEDEYQNQVWSGVEAAAREADVNLLCICGGILESPGPGGVERNFLFELARSEAIDGLVVMSGSISNAVGVEGVSALVERLASRRACSIGVPLPGLPNVLVDNATGLRRSIREMVRSRGARRIAFVRGPVQNEEAALRFQAYREALEECGLPYEPELVTVGDFQKPSGALAVETLLDARGLSFDAIVASNDYMALGALDALLDRGVRVPDDVGLSGFDDVDDARFARVPLSTVSQPLHEQGHVALKTLLDALDGRTVGDVVLDTQVVTRSSCGVRSAPFESASTEWLGAEVEMDFARTPEYAQAQHRLRQAHEIRLQRQFGEALSASMAESDVIRSVREGLPNVGVSSACLALYDPLEAAGSARISFVDPAAPPRDDDVEVVPRAQVLARAIAPAAGRRATWVLQPLFAKERSFGAAFFELGPARGTLYESLREQISAALRVTALMRRLMDEQARRQAAENEQVARELEIAAKIQTAILPRVTQVPGLEIAASMTPVASVGGDYYDVLPVAGGCWLGIGDVAGHGLSTGLVMLMIQSVVSGLRAAAPDAAPNQLIGVLNEVIYENVRDRLEQDQHATLALIRYSSDGELRIAGGHEDLVLYRARDHRCELIRTPGPWVGAFREVDETNVLTRHRLSPGDVLLLYTDGVTEALDASGRQYGLERLCGELASVADESVTAIVDHLVASVRRWQIAQDDDITLVVARYTGVESTN